MNFESALAYLLSLGHETLTIKLGLRNTEILLSALGNPHQKFPAVQIAGTNGKGSTAAMLEAICLAAGLRTGLFTSPHLISITERIRIAGQEVSEIEFARLTLVVKQTAEDLVRAGQLEALPTFFEHITAIALLAFREAKVDLAILETGLGGRLDSTTAVKADIVAITPVAMDHQEYLGHTLTEIAGEKAAIIRPGVAAVIAPQNEEARSVIEKRCQAVGVACKFPGSLPDRDAEPGSADGRFRLTLKDNGNVSAKVLLGLRGRHQVTNAAVAVALVEELRSRGFRIPGEAVIRGLETARHPGRLEIWDTQPRMLFDGAHNPSAALVLRDYLDQFVSRPLTLIFGVMRDKALAEIAALLFPISDELILTEMANPRSASVEILSSLVAEGFDRSRVHFARSADVALQIAGEVTPRDGLICVTGSLYLVGAVQEAAKRVSLESSSAKA